MSGDADLLHTAGVVLVRRADPLQFLLLRAYRNWEFPKGMLEVGEAPLHAALRELQEETGLGGSSIAMPWGEMSIETPAYRTAYEGKPRLKEARYFLAEQLDDAAVVLSSEHHEAAWFDLPSTRAKVVPRLRAVVDWALTYVL